MAAPVYPAWVRHWLSGQWRNKRRPPVLRPSRDRPLALADKVANRREQSTEATCITEMSVMMACWKRNDFNDSACAEEIRMFYDCVAKAEKERRIKMRTPCHPGKLAFKQSEQAPEEVSSDHTLCIMYFTKGTGDKQLKLGSFVKKRKVSLSG